MKGEFLLCKDCFEDHGYDQVNEIFELVTVLSDEEVLRLRKLNSGLYLKYYDPIRNICSSLMSKI
jgi:hypothetical protein